MHRYRNIDLTICALDSSEQRYSDKIQAPRTNSWASSTKSGWRSLRCIRCSQQATIFELGLDTSLNMEEGASHQEGSQTIKDSDDASNDGSSAGTNNHELNTATQYLNTPLHSIVKQLLQRNAEAVASMYIMGDGRESLHFQHNNLPHHR